MRIITCFGDWTSSGTFFIIVSDEDHNFMNVFNCVASPCVFSFLTISMGFNFNLTYRLKSQVSGIKIATMY